MNSPFSQRLSNLRKAAKLTNNELARKAEVPESLIAGLQSDKRRIGELQARRLGTALGLNGSELEQFVMCAIDTCTEKVLEKAKNYPAQLINLIARQLHKAGILADSIREIKVCGHEFETDITLLLVNGQSAIFKTQLTTA